MAAKKNADIRFDFETLSIRGGISKAIERKYEKRAEAALARMIDEAKAGKLGYWKLPEADISDIVKQANRLKKEFENLVIIGIGGSALGARMLFNALAHRYHNELAKRPKNAMRIYFLENDDPDSFDALLGHLDLAKSVFNVVSKSGSTAETASQFLLVRDKLQKKFGKRYTKHLLFTTDPENGILRGLADEEGVETLSVPQDVGGRYSVLSAVGLLPALCMGADAKALLAGAKRMALRLEKKADNPALLPAVAHIAAHAEKGVNMLVTFPYADKLRDWSEWFAQLWAESLGKEKTEAGKKINAGVTPIKALGAIDQHSQVQLYMEGPSDKIFLFIRPEEFKKKLAFPAKGKLPDALQYFAGHNMQELILAEAKATRFALTKMGRMNYEITIGKIDADSIGQLVFWAEALTTLACYIQGVNPFDQPGVELGKKYAYGLMGRAGFEKYRKEVLGK